MGIKASKSSGRLGISLIIDIEGFESLLPDFFSGNSKFIILMRQLIQDEFSILILNL